MRDFILNFANVTSIEFTDLENQTTLLQICDSFLQLTMEFLRRQNTCFSYLLHLKAFGTVAVYYTCPINFG